MANTEGDAVTVVVGYPFKGPLSDFWTAWCPCGWSQHNFKLRRDASRSMERHQAKHTDEERAAWRLH